jgi:hypothetical protein
VARVLARRFEPSVHVEGDAFFGFIERGAITPWLREANEQNEVVTQAAAAAAGRYAAAGFLTVYDGMVGPWFLSTFLRATDLDSVDYVVLMPSVERCIERVGTRQGHGFTDEGATRHMYREFARADIDRRHVLLDPPDDLDKVADRIVAALEQDLLVYRGNS